MSTNSALKMDDGTSSDPEQPDSSPLSEASSRRLPNGGATDRSEQSGAGSEAAMLREENGRLMAMLLEYKKMLESTKLRYGTVKKDYYAAKKRLKRLTDKLRVGGADGSGRPSLAGSSADGAGSESGESALAQTAVDVDEMRKKWKEPNLKSAVKLKAAIGVQAYQSLIRDGELQLPSLRTISRYVDTLKKTGLKPNYDFNVRDSETVGQVFVEEDDSGDVDHNCNQQKLPIDASDYEDDHEGAINFVAIDHAKPQQHHSMGGQPKLEPIDPDEDDDDLYQNGSSVNGEIYRRHPNQHTVHQQQQTLTAGHIEFLKSMTGFRKKWTPFELRTCMDIRRIIGSKEYDSLRKNDGMPLPSAKTLRKYKHAAHLDGVDVMGRKRTHREMIEGVVGMGNGVNGLGTFGENVDVMNAEEPEGFFDINGLSEEHIDFLQSLSSNTKGFSDYELQKTLELKNELGGKNYEILRKQECLHIPTLALLRKYEHENGLEDLAAMVVVEDQDEDDDQEVEQEQDNGIEPQYNNGLHLPDFAGLDMNGAGDDSHMGIFEHHSIFDKDEPCFDMSKLSAHHIEFLNTLPENPKRWTPFMINSALDIKNEIGTRDYELLRRQGIPLPAARTLRRHKDIKSRVGENSEVVA